ncbi:MAG: helix-turn-helix transcriptional regulator [Eggerthellaceae bacterium]|nr:helix-turn-helix transcriptional regulator [Eggerthellaceae bacterium]
MNQAKIGRFIASCRKEQGMTQAALAERLGISDRAVSKWETGRSMPDSGIMLELCGLLGINVNELLSGERIMEETYSKRLEENLLDLTQQKEEKDRQMLRLEVVIGYTATASFLTLVFVASFVEMPSWLRVLLIVVGSVMFAVGIGNAVKIEQTAGYYECPNCGHRYVPSYMSVFWARHIWRTRKMTCPECGERGWHKKVLTKE